jgi:hypothetical protein
LLSEINHRVVLKRSASSALRRGEEDPWLHASFDVTWRGPHRLPPKAYVSFAHVARALEGACARFFGPCPPRGNPGQLRRGAPVQRSGLRSLLHRRGPGKLENLSCIMATIVSKWFSPE